MIPPITFEEMRDIIRAQVSPQWWDDITSDPDGCVLVYGAIDTLVAADQRDADDAASLRVRPAPSLSGRPASGAEYATTTLGIRRTRVGRRVTLPAGTLVQTSDEHIYRTTAPVTFGAGELVEKAVEASAVSPGWPGIIPAGAIDRFVPIANGVSGVGTEIQIGTTTGSFQAMRFTTDLEQPHLFRSSYVGLYLEITSCASQPSQVGRQFQIDSVKIAFLDTENLAESRYAWTAEFDSTTDAEFSGITSDAYPFEWVIRDWAELGFVVRNTVAATGGRLPMLDAAASARGRARLSSESDEQVRARLLRAPELPSPIGVLRKAIVAVSSYGVRRDQIQIYELGLQGADSVDLYKVNFPAACGFINSLHCASMSTPVTPLKMYSRRPDYTLVASTRSPGLALKLGGVGPFAYLVRWDPPAGMSADVVKTVRRLLWRSLKDSRPGGGFYQLYNPAQWGYG